MNPFSKQAEAARAAQRAERERDELARAEQERAEREEMRDPRNVVALIELGATTSEIVELTGLREHDVHAAVMTYYAQRLPLERRVQLERVEELISECWRRARNRGKAVPVQTIMQLLKREAALLGLDEPKRTHVDTTITTRLDPDLSAYSTEELLRIEETLEAARASAARDVTPALGTGHA